MICLLQFLERSSLPQRQQFTQPRYRRIRAAHLALASCLFVFTLHGGAVDLDEEDTQTYWQSVPPLRPDRKPLHQGHAGRDFGAQQFQRGNLWSGKNSFKN